MSVCCAVCVTGRLAVESAGSINKNIENVLLGISPASICSWPTFRNPVSVPSSKAGGRLWGVRGSKV